MGKKASAHLDEPLPRCFRIDVREVDRGLVDERAIGRVSQSTQNLAEDKRRPRSNDFRFLRLLCSSIRFYT